MQKQEALMLGANDLLTRPLDTGETVLRVQNVLAAKAHQDQLSQSREREPRYRVINSERMTTAAEAMIDNELVHQQVELIDISLHGAKFSIDRSLPKGTIIDLTLQVPELDMNVTISAEVRWSQLRSGGHSHVGCSFITPLSADIYVDLATVGLLDRRLEPRRQISLDASVQEELAGKEADRATILDYSSGGMRVRCQNSKRLGERLLIELRDPEGNLTTIPAKTIWQREFDDGFHVGCCFLNNDGYESLQRILRSRRLLEAKKLNTVEEDEPRPFRLKSVWWLGLLTILAWIVVEQLGNASTVSWFWEHFNLGGF
jgi:hypothetical protein